MLGQTCERGYNDLVKTSSQDLDLESDSPLHVPFLPEPVREVPQHQTSHPQAHDIPPDLDGAGLLVLADGQERHPDVDKPDVGQHPHEVDEKHVLIKTNQSASWIVRLVWNCCNEVTGITSDIVDKHQLWVVHPPLLSLHEYVSQVLGQLVAYQLQVSLGRSFLFFRMF